jgi:hypothetical protein
MESMIKEKKEDRGKDQAIAQIENIVEMIKDYTEAEKNNNDEEMENARQTIEEDPLSLQIRSDWYSPGSENNKPAEFEILLCTGGPAVRIVGDLNEYCQPENPKIEYQDWFTPWIEYYNTDEEQQEAILRYCQIFYFGE